VFQFVDKRGRGEWSRETPPSLLVRLGHRRPRGRVFFTVDPHMNPEMLLASRTALVCLVERQWGNIFFPFFCYIKVLDTTQSSPAPRNRP
jgi:hypothetical protein